jgi:hypothetical protein
MQPRIIVRQFHLRAEFKRTLGMYTESAYDDPWLGFPMPGSRIPRFRTLRTIQKSNPGTLGLKQLGL